MYIFHLSKSSSHVEYASVILSILSRKCEKLEIRVDDCFRYPVSIAQSEKLIQVNIQGFNNSKVYYSEIFSFFITLRNNFIYIHGRRFVFYMHSMSSSEHTTLSRVHGIIQSKALNGLISITKGSVDSPCEHVSS